MKLPQRNCRKWTVLATLRDHGPLTVADGIALHGDFGRMRPHRLQAMYDSLVMTGCAVVNGIRYALSAEAQAYYFPLPAEAPVPIVPPRRFNALTCKPLDALRYGLNPMGSRPGSNDYRGWPSVHAPFSKKEQP